MPDDKNELVNDRGQFLADHVEFFERNVEMLKTELLKWMHAHAHAAQQVEHFGNIMENMAAQEPFKPLGKALRAMSQSAQAMNQTTHAIMIERPENKMLAMVAQIQQQAIATKRLLKDRENAIKTQFKIEKEHAMIIAKPRAAEKKIRALNDQKRRVENVDALVDYHIQQLELFRLTKLKTIFEELVRSEMFYHAKALENIPACTFLQSNNIDPKEAVKDLAKNIQQL